MPVAVASPLLRLQKSIGNLAVQRLVGAPHLVQHTPHLRRQPKPDATADKDKEEADKQNVAACLKQKTELLPKVGVVEHINRDVALDEILGQERHSFEEQIRKDHDARRFVCEAGVPAMMALFYNRDWHNRLWVDRARESLAKQPEFYSMRAFDKFTRTKMFLKARYWITTEPGDKGWSPEDIALLAEALGQLTDQEIPLIENYRFIRWTNKCNQQKARNPDYECTSLKEDYGTCGLHEAEIAGRRYTITMYDCFKTDPDEFAKLGFKGRPGAETIVHEIGHAMEYGKLRLALEQFSDASKKYQRLKQQADAATADKKAALNTQVKDAKQAMDDADKIVNTLTSSSILDKFKSLTKGKPALTPYSKTGDTEAFAEAFKLFKVAPDKLEKANKKLFDWFASEGFI